MNIPHDNYVLRSLTVSARGHGVFDNFSVIMCDDAFKFIKEALDRLYQYDETVEIPQRCE